MDDATEEEIIIRRSLIKWVNCTVKKQAIQCLADLVTETNNRTISEILCMIDEDAGKEIVQPQCGTIGVEQVFTNIVSYLSGFTHQQLYDVVDVRRIAKEQDERELTKLVTILLSSAVQCNNCQTFIESITTLDTKTQHWIKFLIESVMNKLGPDGSGLDATCLDKICKAKITEESNKGVCLVCSVVTPTYKQSPRDSVFSDSPIMRLMSSPQMKVKQNQSQALEKQHQKNKRLLRNIEELRHVQSENELDIAAKNRQIDVQNAKISELESQVSALNQMEEEMDAMKQLKSDYEKAQKESERLKKKIQNLEDFKNRCDDLKESSTKFYEERNQFEKERDNMEQVKSQCDKYREQNHQLDFKLQELEAALVRRDTVITDLRQAKDEALQAASQSRELLRELNVKGSLSHTCFSTGEEQLDKDTFPTAPNIEAQVIELKFANERLKDQVAEVNRKEFMEMKDEIKRLLRSKKGYEEHYVEVKSQLLGLQDKLTYKESQSKQREEAFEKQIEISQKSLKSYQQQLEVKTKEVHRLQSEIEALTNENKAHTTAAENRRSATAKEMEDLQQKLTNKLKKTEDELTQKVDGITREKDQIKQEHIKAVQERDASCEMMEKKCMEANEKVKNLVNERNKLKEDYEDILQKIEEVTREKELAHEEHSEKLHQVNEVVIQRDVNYYELERIKEQQEQLIIKLKDDNEKLVQKMDDAVGRRETECCQLQQTVQELTKRIEQVTGEREQVKEAYEELLADVRTELETEVENRKRVNIEFQQARNSWRDLEQLKDHEIQAGVGEVETLKVELKTTQEQLSSEKASELRALHEELDQVTEEMNKNREEMGIRLYTLETENSEKSGSLEEFTKTCQRLNMELTAMEEKLLETTKAKNLAEEEYRAEREKLREKLREEVTQLVSQNADTARALDENRKEFCAEQRKNQEHKDKIGSLITQNAELQASYEDSVEKLEKENQFVKQLTSKKDELTSSLEQKGVELANEIIEKQKIKENMERLTFQSEDLKRTHASAIQEMVGSRQEERKTHAHKVEELESQLNETCQNLQAAMHDISTLHDEKAKLENEIKETRSEKQALVDCLKSERETSSKSYVEFQKSFDLELAKWRTKNEAVKHENVNLCAELCEAKKEHVAKVLEMRREERESEEQMEEDARKLREELQICQMSLEEAKEANAQYESKLKQAQGKETELSELQRKYSVLESKCEELSKSEKDLENEKFSLRQEFEKEIEEWRNQSDELNKTVREAEENKKAEILKLENEAIEREVEMSTEIEELKQKLVETATPIEQLKGALKAAEEVKAHIEEEREALQRELESKEDQLKQYTTDIEEKSKLVVNLEGTCSEASVESEMMREELCVLEEKLEEEQVISRRHGTEVRSLDAQLRHANEQIRQLKSLTELPKRTTRVERDRPVPVETGIFDDSLEDTLGGELQMHDLETSRKKESRPQSLHDKSTRSLTSVSSHESMRSNASSVTTRSATAARRQSMIYLKGSTPPENRTTNSGPYFIVGGQMDLGEEEHGPECDWQRIGELNRRNQTQRMPHLRTSYPVEMTHVPPVCSVSEERLRSGKVTLQSSTSEKLPTSRKRKSPETSNATGTDRPYLSKSMTTSKSDGYIQEKRSRTSRFTDRFSSTFSSFRGSKSRSNESLSKSFVSNRGPKEVKFQEADSSVDPRRESVAFNIGLTPTKPKKAKVSRRRTITRSTATTQLVQEDDRQMCREDLKSRKPKETARGQRYPLRPKQTNQK